MNFKKTALVCGVGAACIAGVITRGEDKAMPDVYILDAAGMQRVKKSLKAGEDEYRPALNELEKKAKECLSQRIPSVMDKKYIPPSGDKHDWMSWAIYWWPDPSKLDGKPYIRKDGMTNPEVLNGKVDGRNAKFIFKSLPVLALAYYYTGNEDYAKKAAEGLRVWFIDPATRMNPHLKYAEGVPGRSNGRLYGIITFSMRMQYIIDSIGLIKSSKHWSSDDDAKMREWVNAYVKWLKTDPMAKGAQKGANNHGTWFAAQMALLQLYLNDSKGAAKTVKDAFTLLFPNQFDAEGKQPMELSRTRSIDYTVMNMRGWLNIARLGQLAGVDYWTYKAPQWQSLEKGLEFLAPYTASRSKWPYKQIKRIKRMDIFELMQRAYNAYQKPVFLKSIESIPVKQVKKSIVQLKFPLKKK
jgi:hypothetical protein